jgi:hypothetical protein
MSPAPEWAKRRKAELEARAPTKRKKVEPFVQMPLRWVEAAAEATGSPVTILLVELFRLRWRTQRTTFPLPNGRLAHLGVSREVKRRVLRDLERAGLIMVERPARKSPGRHPNFALTVYGRHIPTVYGRHMICLRDTHTVPIIICSLFLSVS